MNSVCARNGEGGDSWEGWLQVVALGGAGTRSDDAKGRQAHKGVAQ